jgi:hypothetical protein
MWAYGSGGQGYNHPHVMHHQGAMQPAPQFGQQVAAVPCANMRGPCSHRALTSYPAL